MQELLSEIRGCEVCKAHLPLEPRPIVAGTINSKIIFVSQAPGRKAHVENKAWDDPSGKKLREWLGVNEEVFYNPNNFAQDITLNNIPRIVKLANITTGKNSVVYRILTIIGIPTISDTNKGAIIKSAVSPCCQTIFFTFSLSDWTADNRGK